LRPESGPLRPELPQLRPEFQQLRAQLSSEPSAFSTSRTPTELNPVLGGLGVLESRLGGLGARGVLAVAFAESFLYHPIALSLYHPKLRPRRHWRAATHNPRIPAES